ncbi:MAG: hypothetical protein FWG45_02950 [Oscillospiraceae bacterium]|nr:hypothetical protein [Oscillospiraceae bacterium]
MNKPRFDDAGLVVGGSVGILHGNNARINPKKPIIPQWNNVIGDHSENRYGRYNRLDVDLQDRAAIAKDEVDANPLS